jgi:hypothetical protein
MHEAVHIHPTLQVWRPNENKTGIDSISNITLKARRVATVIWPDSKPSRLTKINHDLWRRR